MSNITQYFQWTEPISGRKDQGMSLMDHGLMLVCILALCLINPACSIRVGQEISTARTSRPIHLANETLTLERNSTFVQQVAINGKTPVTGSGSMAIRSRRESSKLLRLNVGAGWRWAPPGATGER